MIMSKRKHIYENFIEKAKQIHGDKYNYDEVEIVNSLTKVKIFCKKHKEYFFQRIYGHLEGKGCPKCANENRNNNRKYTTESFIKRANIIHKNKYDYSKTIYSDSKTKVIIICPIHGQFLQIPSMHLKGEGCLLCSIEKIHNDKKLPFKEFIKRAKYIFGNKYSYFQSTYDSFHKNIKIYCKSCKHIFFKKVYKHLQGYGCPYCSKKISTGEQKIMKWLEDRNINFYFQKTFKNCRDKHLLKFDFYLPCYNMCVEYQGRQHYESIILFDKEETLLDRQRRDNIKREFCKNNGIKLLEIKYNENIEQILQVNCQAED